MTKQWISMEDAAIKYQISPRQIFNWCDKFKVTFSVIDHNLLLDENSLKKCIKRNIRLSLSLSQEELQECMEEKIRKSHEKLFLLQSLKELTPIIRILITELSELIRDDERREFFLFIALQGNLKDYAAHYHKSYAEAQELFQGLVLEIKQQGQFLRNYKEVNIFLKARLRSYEIQDRKQTRAQQTGEQTADVTVLSDQIVALLNTSVSELGFNIRVQHALAPTNIETLRHLLLFTREYGFKGLHLLHHIGVNSQTNIVNRLRELNILDDKDTCELYKYLGE